MYNGNSDLDRRTLNRFLKNRARSRDFYLALVLFLFSLVTLVYLIPNYVETAHADGMAVKPNFFPYAITILLAFLSILLLLNSGRTSLDVSRSEDKAFTKIIFAFVLLLFVYYGAMLVAGMVPVSIVALFGLIRVFGYQRWLRALVFSVVFVLIIFFFFEKIAQVSIPRGILFEGWY